MRLTLSLAVAALLAATPAVAQNTEEPAVNADTTATNAVGTNDVTGNVAMTPPDAAAAPGTQTATLPPDSSTAAVDTAVTRDREGHGFPWGVFGLVGLIGLLGRKRAS